MEILPAGFAVEGQTGIARIRSHESKHQEDIFIDGGKLNGRNAAVIRRADRVKYAMSGIFGYSIEEEWRRMSDPSVNV